jgi:hypothetical protein
MKFKEYLFPITLTALMGCANPKIIEQRPIPEATINLSPESNSQSKAEIKPASQDCIKEMQDRISKSRLEIYKNNNKVYLSRKDKEKIELTPTLEDNEYSKKIRGSLEYAGIQNSEDMPLEELYCLALANKDILPENRPSSEKGRKATLAVERSVESYLNGEGVDYNL